VALLGLRRRGEDRLGKPAALLEAAGQGDPADGAARAVFVPAAAREVAAGDALDRDHLRRAAQHRAARERPAVRVGETRDGREIGAEDVIADDPARAEEREPAQAHRGQEASLARDRRRHDDIERAQAVGGDDEERCCGIRRRAVHVAHLSFAATGERELRAEDGCGNPRGRRACRLGNHRRQSTLRRAAAWLRLGRATRRRPANSDGTTGSAAKGIFRACNRAAIPHP